LLAHRGRRYRGLMGRRIAAAGLFLLAAYVTWITIGLGIVMARSMFGNGWLGPEPELLYLLAGGLLVAVFVWFGVRLWRPGGAARPRA
jgi:hypothetical protein